MEYIVCAILILIIILSIRELLKTKKKCKTTVLTIYIKIQDIIGFY